MTWKWYK